MGRSGHFLIFQCYVVLLCYVRCSSSELLAIYTTVHEKFFAVDRAALASYAGRFCGKPPGNGSRVGAGVAWTRGVGPCGRPWLGVLFTALKKPTLWGQVHKKMNLTHEIRKGCRSD